jgi:hypothetical protein
VFFHGEEYMKKQLVAAFTLSLVASGLVVGGTISAAQAAVPACVETSAWSDFPSTYAKATNTCSSSKRVYFRWDRAVDGDCTTIGARGGWRREGRAYQARFAGLTSC